MKTKKLLILVRIITEKKKIFTNGIASKLPKDTEIFLQRFSDLVFYIDGQKTEVAIDGISHNVRDFDLVYFRHVGRNIQYLASALATCLDSWKITYFDTTFGKRTDGNKLTAFVKLSLAGLPMIPTCFCWHNKLDKEIEGIIAKLGLPLVVKRLNTQRGHGVFLVNNLEEMATIREKYPEEEFLFQKYFPTDEEYRLLVLGKEVGVFERKTRTNPAEFRNNVAQGATEEFIDTGKIPTEMRRLAITAAGALDLQIAGIDILVDKRGKMWLLEVNRGPGFTYDPDVSPELLALTSFFTQELAKRR